MSLSLEELSLAILQLPTHKTPDLDGFPAEWYTHFRHLLDPILLNTYNEALNDGVLPPSMRKALIILILKPQKDPLKCDSYWPIFLINVDVKILAKSLNKVVVKLVGSDYGGFIPGRSTRMHIHRLFHNLTYPHDCSPTCVV